MFVENGLEAGHAAQRLESEAAGAGAIGGRETLDPDGGLVQRRPCLDRFEQAQGTKAGTVGPVVGAALCRLACTVVAVVAIAAARPLPRPPA
ncbi:hypothetical protein QWZ10_14200 [Paracoccus cavernae]|uniref:Uncharacterized protein n=1 Tax=Paracoccus cavernae TaxID=1571207 RepID=A0ABT8D773_9RHOB|nr:hypothetical protein [Paracoccus cavernae]